MEVHGHGGSRASKKRKKKQDGAVIGSKAPKAGESTSGSAKKEETQGEAHVSINWEEERVVKVEGRSILDILALEDPKEATSSEKAALLLSTLLEPAATLDSFYREYWGKKPLCAHRDSKSFLKGLLSKRSLANNMEDTVMYLGQDIELFANGHGETEGNYPISGTSGISEEAEVASGDVWKHFKSSGILRLLQPQKYHDVLWNFLASLEIEFGSRVGCHADIIPPTSAGWGKILMDTSDSFVVQLYGSSSWRLYARKKDQAHTSKSSFTSSSAVSQEEVLTQSLSVDGFISTVVEQDPYVEATMQAGDTLYIPKGWGFSFRGSGEQEESGGGDKKKESKLGNANVHLRLFTNSLNSVGDLLELTLPAAMETCRQEEAAMEASLPRTYASVLGATNSELDDDAQRNALLSSLQARLQRVFQVAATLLDSSADQLVKTFMGQRMPVPLSSEEESKSSACIVDPVIKAYTRVRMIRPGVARVVIEDGTCVLYHCMDNSREMYGNPLRPLEFDLDDGVCIEAVLSAYPTSIMVADLPHPSEEDEDKVGVVQALFKEGFLLIDDDVTGHGNGGESDGENDDEEVNDEDEDDPF